MGNKFFTSIVWEVKPPSRMWMVGNAHFIYCNENQPWLARALAVVAWLNAWELSTALDEVTLRIC